jgi:hypothetical protein
MTRKTISNVNPVGLKALAKLIVFGDEDLKYFSQSERVFLDVENKPTKNNSIQNAFFNYFQHLNEIKFDYLNSKNISLHVKKLLTAELQGFSAPVSIKSIFKLKNKILTRN